MTMPGEETETCCLCDTTTKFTVIVSTSMSGSPDLDTRPPPLARDTIEYSVRRCPSCGYCAPQISEGPEQARVVVSSERYQRQLSDKTYPESANSFLCLSLLHEELSELNRSGWAALYAAWICDDKNASSAARQCRLRAIDLFRAARNLGMPFCTGDGAEEALLADLLRRAELYQDVQQICGEGLAKNPDDVVQGVLKFQVALAERRDAEPHTIKEALAAEGG